MSILSKGFLGSGQVSLREGGFGHVPLPCFGCRAYLCLLGDKGGDDSAGGTRNLEMKLSTYRGTLST